MVDSLLTSRPCLVFAVVGGRGVIDQWTTLWMRPFAIWYADPMPLGREFFASDLAFSRQLDANAFLIGDGALQLGPLIHGGSFNAQLTGQRTLAAHDPGSPDQGEMAR
jgi:hypothetical protein